MNRRSLVVLSSLVALLTLVTGLLWRGHRADFGSKVLASPATLKPATSSPPRAALPAPPASTPALPQAVPPLDAALAQLTGATAAGTSRRILQELRTALEALPPGVASRTVQAFLADHKDATTQLDVTIQPGGALGDASSLRVFLLDYLGQIDRPAAAAVGRQILSTPTSPDEWAVSLRNIAWADSSDATQIYLRGKARELITNSTWQQNPSAGFLEAFDVIVQTRAVELVPDLTSLVRDHDNRAVAHAAYLTLDRLTLADPAAALTTLQAQPDAMQGREQTRANFFARADVRDPQQRTLLETYLLDPRHSAEELQTFAGLYPNANYMISNNLLTTPATPDHASLAAGDRAALAAVTTWLTDPRFTRLQPQLRALQTRLQTFVQQASGNGN